jgi:predicted MFS family arabinose efflux permease
MNATAPTAAKGALPYPLLILLVGLIVGITMGRAQSMGLYQLPVIGALGVGREPFSLMMAISLLLMGAGSPVSGALIDKYGARWVVAFCVACTIAGLWALHSATSAIWLIVAGVLMGFGVSGTGVTSLVGVVGRLAPPEKRMAAIASTGMAAGIGGFAALPVMHALIEGFGWQDSLVWLMAITALLVLFAWPLDARPAAGAAAAPGSNQTMKEALNEAFGHPSYLLLTAGFFVCGFHVAFITVHLPAYTRDLLLPDWVGPYALMLVGIANIVGTFIAGQSGKWIEKRRGLSLIYFGRSLVFVGFLLVPPSATAIIVLAGTLGLLWLSTVPLTSGLVATFFGTRWMSMLFGIVFFSHQVGSFLGVWLAGRLYDATGSYEAMWWISIALGIASGLVHWPIQEKPVARLAPAT